MVDERTHALLAWYERNRRDLPWRQTTDPYRVLVREVMLQQTQAARVGEPFERFLSQFPSVEDLARAPLADVLHAWSGLGYNRRARFLHEAAKRIVTDGWPTDPMALQNLPGIGPYTAAAVACFAFAVQVPTPDTNHRRVLSRWLGRPLAGAELWAVARDELPDGRAAQWNEALMDLGAVICTARRPACARCPVQAWCPGPDGYSPPAGQGRFEGSSREARGAIVRELVASGFGHPAGISAATGIAPDRVVRALDGLVSDRLVTVEDGIYSLPD